MAFDGATVPQHLADLCVNGPRRFRELTTHLANSLAHRLDRTNEIGRLHRRLDVLMASRSDLGPAGDFSIWGFEIRPDLAHERLLWKTTPFLQWCVCGDDAAQLAAKEVLATTDVASLDAGELHSLAETVIARGIASAGVHQQFTAHKTCGGKACRRSLGAGVDAT